MDLPEGWKRIEDESGQVYYLTRQPQVKITKRSQLDAYHRKGRYLEMSLMNLNFGKKRRLKKYSCAETLESSEAPDLNRESEKRLKVNSDPDPIDEVMEDLSESSNQFGCPQLMEESEFDEAGNLDQQFVKWRDGKKEENPNLIRREGLESVQELTESMRKSDSRKEAQLNVERMKLENAVKKLTLSKDDVIDHKKVLIETAKVLESRRMSVENLDLGDFNLENLKAKVDASKNCEELIIALTSSDLIQKRLSNLVQSKLLEQMLKISSLPENPLKDFPLDVNKNHYSEVINFAVEHTPDVLDLIVKLSTKNEAPIAETDVIRCAYIFSSLASTVSRQNNALKKIKSVSTKTNGLTNSGLDVLANVGIFETSRSFRNDRDFLASLSENILKSYAQSSVPQITFDNMDMCIGNIMHHMTLSFLEFETEDTSHLSTMEKSFEEALDFFKKETVLITSEFNKDLFTHYKYVTAWTLGKLFGEEVEGFSWLKKVFPKHYKHLNCDTSAKKSTLFTQKPLNYCENNNRDMLKIMEHIQLQYLHLVGEQSNDKEAFKDDVKVIYSVDMDKEVREEAEHRVKEAVRMAGVAVLHGDLLTDVRFETCKRLRRMAVTAVERFDFLVYFRLGTFHMGMNKGFCTLKK
jgi:hypothetical protein